ncbi:glycosyl hydrolase family 18 protein [Paenibacillus sp. L3-i20]|uniref:glycosyl hydrolase family 18 protein n=1 Tax=Paenibacillus sp. L3-i20 TaxID=2905833 RepID=UPI001EE04E17|nr:glycosyl hydrolase family 18 protein [Paenibacillus sp. L3-i20]
MRKKEMKLLFIVFLSLALLVSPLLNTTATYADSSVATEQTEQSNEVPAEGPDDVPTEVPTEVPVDVPTEVPTEVPVDVPTEGPDKTPGENTEVVVPNPEVTKPLEPAADAISPLAPQNLSIVEGTLTYNSVQLKWDFRENLDDNDIQIYNEIVNAKGERVWKDLIWGSYWSRTPLLKPETAYKLMIVWNGDSKLEHKSNIIEFTTPADASQYKEHPLTPPLNVRLSNITDTSVTLSWKGSTDAAGYDYYVNGAWISGVWDGSDTVTYTFPNGAPAAGTPFQFIVGSQAKGKDPVKAAPISIKWGELAAPRDLQVITANRTTAALGWTPTHGATNYDIYQGNTLIGSSESPRYVVNGLTEGQSYSFTVVAKNALWKSPASIAATTVPGADYTNFTYYGAWMVYNRNYLPEAADYSQITHINYAFFDLCWLKVNSAGKPCVNPKIPIMSDYVFDGELILGDQEKDLENLAKFKTIKANNPHLKVMASVGGWNSSNYFSVMAKTDVTRRAFANSVIEYLREFNMDGLDIDWEYPVEGGAEDNTRSPDDKQNFTLLMKTVREALDAAGAADGKYYLLTIASGQGDNFTVNADYVNSVQYLDMINIMTYDYSGSWATLAYHNAPLYYDPNNTRSSAKRNNVRGGLLGHLNGGVPDYKLNVGIPYYGVAWEGCPATGQYQTCASTPKGTWGDGDGKFDIFDIENNMVNKNGFTYYWNEYAKAAYVYNPENGRFITFNDQTSMMYFTSLAKTLNLAGVMSWEISADRNKTLTTQIIKDLPIDGKFNATALTAPKNLVSEWIEDTRIQVKWDAVAGAAGYEVYRNHQYVGYTTETKYTHTGIIAATEYEFNVLAVKKDTNKVVEVSPSSQILKATTLINAPIGSFTPAPIKAKDELNTSTSKSDAGLTINILKDASIQTIESAKVTSYKITINENAQLLNIIIPKGVIDAIFVQGEGAQLSIVWKNITYVVPAHAIHLNADIKISIKPTDLTITDEIKKLAQEQGLTVETQPLDFNIFKLISGNNYEEVTNFGKLKFNRTFKLNAKDIDTNRATGVLYLPDSKDFRPVSTVFTKGEKDGITANLVTNGNSIYTIVESNFKFKDVTAEWAKSSIERATARLIVSGETSELFGASTKITRAEFVSIMVRGLGIIPNIKGTAFDDVAVDSKYARDIAVAKELGIVTGKTANTFNPEGTITRQDIAVILANVLKLNKGLKDANDNILNTFRDKDSIALYAKPAVALLVHEKIMQGVSATKFDPKSNISRAQAVVAIVRFLDNLEKTSK